MRMKRPCVNLSTCTVGQQVYLPFSERHAILLSNPTFSSTYVRLYDRDQRTYVDLHIATNILVHVVPTPRSFK